MRLYTLVEARALLGVVRPVLEDIRSAYVRLRMLQSATAADARAASGDGHMMVDPYEEMAGPGEPERLQLRLRAGMEKLQEWGIDLKDPARGLIDFYHQREGEIVYLCYHLGEEDIGYWHPLQSGFAGRAPI